MQHRFVPLFKKQQINKRKDESLCLLFKLKSEPPRVKMIKSDLPLSCHMNVLVKNIYNTKNSYNFQNYIYVCVKHFCISEL